MYEGPLSSSREETISFEKAFKGKKTTHFRIRFKFVPNFPEVLCKEILLDRFPIDTNSFSHCYHVRGGVKSDSRVGSECGKQGGCEGTSRAFPFGTSDV